MKLIGSTKSKITKDENGENLLHLNVTEVVLVHCYVVSNDHQQDSKCCIHIFLINRLVSC